jgi:hypothetical protein
MSNPADSARIESGVRVVDRVLERVDADLYRHDARPPEAKQPSRDFDEGDGDLIAMNDNYAVVQIGGRTRVMYFEESPAHQGCKVPVFQRREDFQSFHLKRKKTFVDANGKEKQVGIGHWWFNHPNRRQYEGIVYAPGHTLPEGIFNLWTGFGCKPRQGACNRFLQHLRENICSGVNEHYEYQLNWMAMGVQRPDRPGEVALVMRGQEGTGKGVLAQTYGGLFGPHFWHVSSPHHLVGHFNAHLEQCSVLFADEALFAGDRSYEAILKALITEETLPIEPKGVDPYTVPNRIHLIIASNSDWVIPASAEARRFFMLDVSDAHRQDRAYFGAIGEELKTGGREALLYDLLHRDISRFDVGTVPQTQALAEQKALSRRDVDRLVETIAHEGRLPAVHPVFANVAVTTGESKGEGFYAAARVLVPDLKHISSTAIARRLHERWECTSWHIGDQRGIRFPLLQVLRGLFDRRHGPQSWPPLDPNDWAGGM